jgi:hypothetical protein
MTAGKAAQPDAQRTVRVSRDALVALGGAMLADDLI